MPEKSRSGCGSYPTRICRAVFDSPTYSYEKQLVGTGLVPVRIFETDSHTVRQAHRPERSRRKGCPYIIGDPERVSATIKKNGGLKTSTTFLCSGRLQPSILIDINARTEQCSVPTKTSFCRVLYLGKPFQFYLFE